MAPAVRAMVQNAALLRLNGARKTARSTRACPRRAQNDGHRYNGGGVREKCGVGAGLGLLRHVRRRVPYQRHLSFFFCACEERIWILTKLPPPPALHARRRLSSLTVC